MAKRDDSEAKLRAKARKEELIAKREREQLRYVYLGIAVVAAVVAVVFLAGSLQTFVLEPRSTIASVDDVNLTTGDYRNRVRYERFQLDRQFESILGSTGGADVAQNQQFLEAFAGQYLQQRELLNREALDNMVDGILISREAEARGITVTEAEIDEEINQLLARDAGGLTELAASETATARAQATETAELFTPTPTFTPSPTLTATTTLSPTATPANTATPAPTPTFNIVSEATLTPAYTTWVQEISTNTGVSEQRYREIVRIDLLSQKLRDAIGNEVSTEGEQARARHILVETEEEALDAIARLEAGEEFGTLAEELSTDPGSAAAGGDLGFVSPGSFVTPVDDAVFTLPLNEISEPVESDFGWHVIEVLEREERELPEADLQRARNQAYADWLNGARASAVVEEFWTPSKAPEDVEDPLGALLPQ